MIKLATTSVNEQIAADHQKMTFLTTFKKLT
jgi:hypothetical protein